MFRIISIIAFSVAFAGIALHHIASSSASGGRRQRPVNILKRLVFLLTLLLLEQRLSLLGKVKKLIYLLALFCFVVLAVTGFYPALILGKGLCGYLLMLHVTFGGIFAGCLAVLVLSWAHRYRFNENDWPWLRRLTRREAAKKGSLHEGSDLARKAAFWLIVLLALPLMLSTVLSMFALFGTPGQHFLADTHRYSALLFALVAIVYTYLIVRAQMRETVGK